MKKKNIAEKKEIKSEKNKQIKYLSLFLAFSLLLFGVSIVDGSKGSTMIMGAIAIIFTIALTIKINTEEKK